MMNHHNFLISWPIFENSCIKINCLFITLLQDIHTAYIAFPFKPVAKNVLVSLGTVIGYLYDLVTMIAYVTIYTDKLLN